MFSRMTELNLQCNRIGLPEMELLVPVLQVLNANVANGIIFRNEHFENKTQSVHVILYRCAYLWCKWSWGTTNWAAKVLEFFSTSLRSDPLNVCT
jgi:hypothetical protein